MFFFFSALRLNEVLTQCNLATGKIPNIHKKTIFALILNMLMKNPPLFLVFSIFLLASCTHPKQEADTSVKIVGKMKDAMWKGELFGKIDLDTLSNRGDLYGLGPVEYLSGEILVLDGIAYKSTVLSDTSMQVEETFDLNAPFFAYARIPNWVSQQLPDSIQTLNDLEFYLSQLPFAPDGQPFLFQLSGTVERALIHVVNLPKETQVSSPEDAHQGKTEYRLEGQPVDILGFFSTKHKTIFTHHDTYLHLHLITKDRKMMGHLDEVGFGMGAMMVLLPKE